MTDFVCGLHPALGSASRGSCHVSAGGKITSKANKISRGGFNKTAGVGAAGLGAGLLLSNRARAAQEPTKKGAKKTLKILQWNHFVPAYDKWFNETYIKEWGAKNDTDVIVDNIGVTALPARLAAESAAGKGHAIFLSMSPPAAYENSVVDMTDLYHA